MDRQHLLVAAAAAALLLLNNAALRAQSSGASGSTPSHKVAEHGSLLENAGAAGYAPARDGDDLRDDRNAPRAWQAYEAVGKEIMQGGDTAAHAFGPLDIYMIRKAVAERGDEIRPVITSA